MTVGAGWLAALGWTLLGAAAHGAQPLPAVYPSGPSVPENLLRIELRLAQPLRHPLSIDQVRLLDAAGRPIDEAFLDLPLPSADGRRVTLLMHPGRVKSGVGANQVLGRALIAGSTVTLVVDVLHLRKTWRVTSADATVPAPGAWTFEAPSAGQRGALTVHLQEPIASSAEALIAVRGPDGLRVAGIAQLGEGETTWRFTPSRPWRAGRFALMVHPDLEDVAGNRACAAFELRVATPQGCRDSAVRPFEVGR